MPNKATKSSLLKEINQSESCGLEKHARTSWVRCERDLFRDVTQRNIAEMRIRFLCFFCLVARRRESEQRLAVSQLLRWVALLLIRLHNAFSTFGRKYGLTQTILCCSAGESLRSVYSTTHTFPPHSPNNPSIAQLPKTSTTIDAFSTKYSGFNFAANGWWQTIAESLRRNNHCHVAHVSIN